jgi:hypothetical protein
VLVLHREKIMVMVIKEVHLLLQVLTQLAVVVAVVREQMADLVDQAAAEVALIMDIAHLGEQEMKEDIVQ